MCGGLAQELQFQYKHEQEHCEVLAGINFLQLTLAKKTEVKNLGHAAPDLVISQPSSSRKHTYVRQLNPAIHTNISCGLAVWKETL
jgi:hypothetical protein